MPKIVLYKCDGPDCDELGLPVEKKYWGSFPSDWLRLMIFQHGPGVDLQSQGPCFHNEECMLNWIRVNYIEELIEDIVAND